MGAEPEPEQVKTPKNGPGAEEPGLFRGSQTR